MAHELVAVVFGATYESLLHGLKWRIDDEAEQRLARLGINAKRIEPAYPFDVFQPALEVLAEAAYPSLQADDAMFQLGRDYILGMASTVVGSALYGLARVLGPRRMLERMTRNARTSNNFTETVLESLPDGTFRMISGVRPELRPQMAAYNVSPHYFRGIVHEAMVQSGANAPQVDLESNDVLALQTRYLITLSKA